MADQVADIPPKMAILLFLLIDSFFKSSEVADIPPKMAILDSYS